MVATRMHERKLSRQEIGRFVNVLELYKVVPIIKAITVAGGVVFCVGGAVRDLLLNISIKDLDFEVHGLSEQELVDVLSLFGSVAKQGKAFGVMRVNPWDIDWSLPRSDGSGRRPKVTIDPDMGLVEALRRRDLTMNALAIDVTSYQLYDPFGGEKDLRKKILRAVDANFFVEDPLRLYRVMQFLARFEMSPDHTLNTLCGSIDVASVSRERVEEELRKLFIWSIRPSLGFRWLLNIGQLTRIFPEIACLSGVQQSPVWHPEGDVFEHTMQVLDAVAQDNRVLEEVDYLVLCYAALCHDMGKVTTTRLHQKDGRLVSYGHEDAGIEPARTFLGRVTTFRKLIVRVLRLVKYHMRPCALVSGKAGCAAYRRLAARMVPDSLEYLARIARADKRGRNGESSAPLSGAILCVDLFIQKAEECGVVDAPIPSVLSGNDLLAYGVSGPRVGELLAKAYEYQIARGVEDRASLLAYLGFE